LEIGIWNLEIGIWRLDFGIWNLEIGFWNSNFQLPNSKLSPVLVLVLVPIVAFFIILAS
jgi:hypothetical protein